MKGFGTLYVYELKKILGQRLALVSLLLGVVMIFGWNLVTLNSTGYYYDYDAQQNEVERLPRPYGEVEKIRRDYMRGLSGQELDDTLMEQLTAGYGDSDTGTRQWNLNSYSPFRYLNTMLSRVGVTAQGFYRSEVWSFWVNPEENLLTEEEIAYWQEQASGLGTFILDYAGGWQGMAQDCGLLCQVAVLLSAACVCRLFSEEHRTRTDQLVLTSARGKTTAFWARWCAGVSFAAGLTLTLSGVYILAYCIFYGPDGFSTALQLWSEGVALPLHLSMGGYVLVMVALLVLGSMAMVSLVMLLSELLGWAVVALVVPFLLSGVTVLGLFQGHGRLVEQVSSYLPFLRISTHTLTDYYLAIFRLNAIQFSVPVYVLAVLVLGGLCWLSYRNYQVTGR
ncbi:hypothetical protein H9X86_11095 [Pseudoflavonifractor capillosus]|uniref:hypothetical protein n=1 Tax=Pseudoflavonifractor capillosus TaxID=106588 RepID=UPI00195BD276|nr:hypothetical protein [Pseudoflavonifractor capillosus]MBM6897889.1 hypothetical protein [Pseudoflavonifractor capillosus]